MSKPIKYLSITTTNILAVGNPHNCTVLSIRRSKVIATACGTIKTILKIARDPKHTEQHGNLWTSLVVPRVTNIHVNAKKNILFIFVVDCT